MDEKKRFVPGRDENGLGIIIDREMHRKTIAAQEQFKKIQRKSKERRLADKVK